MAFTPSRRAILISAGWLSARPPAIAAGNMAGGDLLSVLTASLVRSYYLQPPARAVSEAGVAGINAQSYHSMEDQRFGAEWIMGGLVAGRTDWVQRGWRALDVGLAHQRNDGSFDHGEGFHSTSLFVEGLGRALLLDPAGATPARIHGLKGACDWMTLPETLAAGAIENAPFTHRRYIVAAAFGQAGLILSDPALRGRAEASAGDGLRSQTSDGCNPEKGGFDVSYQMVGVLLALRYSLLADQGLRSRLLAMARRAVALERQHVGPDGRLDEAGSTRAGTELHYGAVKHVDWAAAIQAVGLQAVIADDADAAAFYRRLLTAYLPNVHAG